MKKLMIAAVALLAAGNSYAQTEWTVGLQNRFNFAKSQGYWEEQKLRLESVDTWVFGELKTNGLRFRLGPSYMRTDMGEQLFGFCATRPLTTYTMIDHRLGYRLAAGREFSLGKAGSLTLWAEMQQYWLVDVPSPYGNDVIMIMILPEDPTQQTYFGTSIGVEYNKVFFEHLLIGAGVNGTYVHSPTDGRMSPFKIGGSLSISYRF